MYKDKVIEREREIQANLSSPHKISKKNKNISSSQRQIIIKIEEN